MSTLLPLWVFPAFILLVLIIAGVGEYFHLAPPGTFSSLLLVSIGLIAPSPAFPHMTVVNSSPTPPPPTKEPNV